MIPIYIASSQRFEVCEPVIKASIEANASVETRITFMRPDTLGVPETGCTGFTNLRFAVPELLRRDGFEFGIYFDVDMLILGDIAELFEYRRPGRYVCLADLSTEVGVVSAEIKMPALHDLGTLKKWQIEPTLPKKASIPLSWNCEDRFDQQAKLIHFTDLKRQPWFYDNHPSADAVSLWEHYANLAQSL